MRHRIRLLLDRYYKSTENEGGTLMVEFMVVIFIFILVSGLTFMILAGSNNALYIENANIEVQQELRKAMTVMAEDIREAGLSKIELDGSAIPTANGTWSSDDNTITFRMPTSAGVQSGYIEWSPVIQFARDTDTSQLLRDATVVANNISSLKIRRQVASPDIVEVALIATKTTVRGTQITNTLEFQVKPRN